MPCWAAARKSPAKKAVADKGLLSAAPASRLQVESRAKLPAARIPSTVVLRASERSTSWTTYPMADICGVWIRTDDDVAKKKTSRSGFMA